MIAERLVYGCARLTGGASAAASRRLIEACLAAGVRHFDSAPSYGMGTAERVLGSVLAGRPDVRVTAKVGSLRPRFATARTWARAVKAVAKPRSTPLREEFTPLSANAHSAPLQLSREAMVRSVEISRNMLQRQRLDALLLHEVQQADVGDTAIAVMETMLAQGIAAEVGYSTGTMAEPGSADSLPKHWIAQTAVSPDMLVGPAPRHASDFLHTIVNTVFFRQRSDEAFAGWLVGASELIPETVADRRTALIVAGYARLHTLMPDHGLIFASIVPDRLAAFLAGVTHVDRNVGAERFGESLVPATASDGHLVS